ncbi:MAG: hypothetical protein HLUCCA11_22610 [Phormidesmis priestleyi Ana]|uniref:Uncharacterized protein n=1 Tax=Phormidesmis priestleyi Ana TaxID=1666911 RepID=A0A0P8BE99_9CYAN|nr:MAG: hypothetical protein HLUCCA11_22610 [Phormidesmis priestleyi Ana]
MSYTEDSRSPLPTISERPVYTAVTPVVEYHDRVRWGPILAGLMITIVSQLVLSALGGVIGLTAVGSVSAGTAGTVATIWAIFSLLISLFLGGWMMARTCGPMNKKSALLNGTILWATTLALGAWLLTSGVSGTLGLAATSASAAVGAVDQVPEANGAALPNPAAVLPNAQAAQQYAANAAKAGLIFLFGSLLGWAATLIGSIVGSKTPSQRVA